MGRRRRRPVRCPRFKRSKHIYRSVVVARYDCSVLQATRPEFIFEVFRCTYCNHWHIGRKKSKRV